MSSHVIAGDALDDQGLSASTVELRAVPDAALERLSVEGRAFMAPQAIDWVEGYLRSWRWRRALRRNLSGQVLAVTLLGCR
jgi:hypothetical protein